MDEFKKYLQQHRDEMDTDAPSSHLLQRIQLQTVKKPKGKIYSMLLRGAVAACTIAVIFITVKWITKEDKKTGGIIAKNRKAPVNTVTDTLAAAVNNTIPINQSTVIHQQDETIANKKTVPKKESISQQLMQSFEYNYTRLVNLQLKSIRNTPVYGDNADYFNDFKKTLQQTDIDEKTIKASIKNNGLNDMLLEQLINVYQQKVNLLKTLQHEMNRINSKVQENMQPSDSMQTHFINI